MALVGLPGSGTAFFLAPAHTDGGQCLLAALARTPDVRDLGLQPTAPKLSRMN